MKFEHSRYFNSLKYPKLKILYGELFFFDEFVVIEINEGVHLDFKKMLKIMSPIIDFYGADAKIYYISNRINSYSSTPQEWVDIIKENDLIIAGAIVFYTPSSLMNAEIENYICPKEVKGFRSLEKAIDWVQNIETPH